MFNRKAKYQIVIPWKDYVQASKWCLDNHYDYWCYGNGPINAIFEFGEEEEFMYFILKYG